MLKEVTNLILLDFSSLQALGFRFDRDSFEYCLCIVGEVFTGLFTLRALVKRDFL